MCRVSRDKEEDFLFLLWEKRGGRSFEEAWRNWKSINPGEREREIIYSKDQAGFSSADTFAGGRMKEYEFHTLTRWNFVSSFLVRLRILNPSKYIAANRIWKWNWCCFFEALGEKIGKVSPDDALKGLQWIRVEFYLQFFAGPFRQLNSGF